jgi:hypothetical protein
MTQIDVEKLARESGLICSHNINNKIVSCDASRHDLMRFAALVLEHAAAKMGKRGYRATQDELRQMAKELKP